MSGSGMSRSVQVWNGAGWDLVTPASATQEIARLVNRAALWRLPLEDEKRTQEALEVRLAAGQAVAYRREAPMDQGGRGVVDFFEPRLGLAVEVKLAGSAAAITRQLRGYAEDQRVREIVLLTARPYAAPPPLGPRNVTVTVVDIAGGWL